MGGSWRLDCVARTRLLVVTCDRNWGTRLRAEEAGLLYVRRCCHQLEVEVAGAAWRSTESQQYVVDF
jgi:hypothetical protein